ncbi:pyridoxamine 5'-phosphate oxidase family protein [Rhodococcus rhodochrous]|uniref:pyridoxamine 5'-phosphate oxidase family protein n=1 Tax=Rhodococcus rhodochrous TaxID=1829 RepID=UPI001D004A32|nr:pyridoxamine 5'-phosphate oxidase family protein [Rhodococcus rhodochrous]
MSGNGALRTRGAGISMTKEEIDLFLSTERTCRVATIGGDGSPHVAPLWFVWDGAFLWLNSLVRSRRWTDLQKDPRIAVVVDGGEQFTDLRGVEVCGTAVSVGDVPHRRPRRTELP